MGCKATLEFDASVGGSRFRAEALEAASLSPVEPTEELGWIRKRLSQAWNNRQPRLASD
jgi:hypothetical protein